MSNKTTFKRIALGLVTALGMGLLASSSSSAAIVPGSDTLTVSSATSSITAGDSASVTVSASAILGVANTDTLTVNILLQSKPATASTVKVGVIVTETSNAHYEAVGLADNTDNTGTAVGSLTDVASSGTTFKLSGTAASGTQAVSGSFRLTISEPSVAGTYVFTLYNSNGGSGSTVPVATAKTWTVTVAAKNVKPTATNSSIQITGDNRPFVANLADSAVAASALTAAATPVAYVRWLQRNSDSATSVTGTAVGENVVATIVSGPGTLSKDGDNTYATRALTVTAAAGETITVHADGRAGTTVIRFTTASMPVWADKTVTFFSTTINTITATQPTDGNVLSVGSGTFASPTTATGAIRVVPRDAAGNYITTGGGIYLYSSDTSVIKNFGTHCTTTPGATFVACDLQLADSGTAKVIVRDSSTVATSTKASEELTYTIVGTARTVSATFDKATYTAGEKAIVTINVKDGLGRDFATGSTTLPTTALTGLRWVSLDPTFTASTATGDVAGGTTSDLDSYLGGSMSLLRGVDTVVVFMPTTPGNYELVGRTTGSATENFSTKFTVINPAVDAAESALDAAQEATDAAIAATDAAILAQEAADEAASAAVAAQETAQAAVDAVTALSAEVTKLVAQLATLQKLLNRVAKRVGVKL